MSTLPTPTGTDSNASGRHDPGKDRPARFEEALILPLAVLMAYWPAINGGLLFDDAEHLTMLPLRPLRGLLAIWFHPGATVQYYPVLHSFFWLEYHFWGTTPFGYHLWNILLHGLSAYLVVLIVRRLELPGAWLAGFIFALHPVCVESVAWISEQKCTLSTFFCLSSALLYLRFDETRRRAQYLAALALFALALASKSVSATLPAVLLVIVWWRKGRLEWKQDIRPLSGWLVLGACDGLFTAWVERVYVRALGADFALSPLQRTLQAGRVVWFYIGKDVWPLRLMFNYPRWTIDPGQVWQYLYPVSLAVVLVGLGMVARRHRGPLAVLLIFVGSLVPVLGFLNVYFFRYSYVADHLQYPAILAIIIPGSALLTMAVRRLSLARPVALGLAAALVLTLGWLTWRQAHVYTDAETLYRDTLAHNPESSIALVNLCAILTGQPSRLAEATEVCQEALRRWPNLPNAHLNMGLVWARTEGQLPRAISEMETAVQLWPTYVSARYDLGHALELAGRFPEAEEQYRVTLGIIPDYPLGYVGLGNVLQHLPGRQQDAIDAYESALRIAPCDVEAHYGEGTALLSMPHRGVDALEQFEAALQCRPDYGPALQMVRQFKR